MTLQPFNLETRINTLKSVLIDENHRQALDATLREANGDLSIALERLKEQQLPEPSLQKVALAHSLADLADDNLPVVRAIAEQPDLTNLRDVALQFNVERLATIVDPETVPEDTSGTTPDEKKRSFAVSLQHKLFLVEPTAVLQRMVQDAEVPIADTAIRTGVVNFLSNQPNFNIRTTSVYTALKHPEAFKDIAQEQQPNVVEQLKTLQRVQALSPVPEVIPALMNANLTSAFHVAEMPESTFLTTYCTSLGGEQTARQVYTNAVNNRIRNEHALMTMRETMRGTGLAIIDGHQSMEKRMEEFGQVVKASGVPVPQATLETLFGSIDYCECEESTSVYSPAAYFVELLQFLRNNNLDPEHPNTNKKGYQGTYLEMLFRRRPDLKCLELTCENTNTVLPYIDLVNEVMESFVVHLTEYNTQKDPKQAKLEVFNIEDETSSELLAQPQHTNYQAYCILKNAIYPFTLPYHQPIDATRIFLNSLGTSRYELLDTYRTPTETCDNVILAPEAQRELQKQHREALQRAVDAEYLGLTQEGYIILTKEAFWTQAYFETTQNRSYGDAEYHQKIGVKPIPEYYGYLGKSAEKDMLSLDEDPTNGQKGLTFVKKQFLTRTGIQYVDLVELLKTQFINPNYPQGKARTILEGIQFSYRFLQQLVDKNSPDPFGKLIAFLETAELAEWFFEGVKALLHPDECKQQKFDRCLEREDLRNWVKCYFDKIGKLIVLESGEGLQLPIECQLFTPQQIFAGTLHKNGTIVNESGVAIGYVTITGEVVGKDGQPLVPEGQYLEGNDESSGIDVLIDVQGLWINDSRWKWPSTQDTCNLDKVRLTHLNGDPLTIEEYDRIHRFIRLWRKMGWSMDETDKALIGLSACKTGAGSGALTTGECDFVGFDAFVDDCSRSNGSDDNGQNDLDCPDIVTISDQIPPDFLHQLVAVRKLLDLTGLPLIKLLTFWTNISTVGEKSLYSKLFLTHNLLGIDKVFKADRHGNYLTQSAKISEHIPVLMAALKLKADDITEIMKFGKLSDELTLSNVSALYRHSLLAKVLHVKVTDLPSVIALFGNPFQSADHALALLEAWGKMEDAGFTFRQLNYLINNQDDLLRPLSTSKRIILQITKTLYDGLNGIDRDHQDVKTKEEATDDLIRTKAGLLFEQAIVEQILGLLNGTTVYTTNAPANQTITIPDTLSQKLKYNNQKDANPPSATIQVTGILTDAEKEQSKVLCNLPDWSKAIDRLGKQALHIRLGQQTLHIFNDVLFGVFPNQTDAIGVLLAGDVNLPIDPQNPTSSDLNTAPQKRFYFLQYFLPFLRQQLAHRFIVTTLAGTASLPNDVTDLLLTDILTVENQPAIDALECIKQKPSETTSGWKGYLIPSIDANYTFIATSDAEPQHLLMLDGRSIPFPHQQEDPSNVWSTDPVLLKAGKLYSLEVTDRSAEQLRWKTATSPTSAIPASALLPDYSQQGTEVVFTKLYKAALLVNGFGLNSEEVSYWQKHPTDFNGFDFNAITLQHWQRLEAYTTLRNTLPKAETTLLDLFAWASQSKDVTKLSEKIQAATGWKPENIAKLIAPKHFDLNYPSSFRNEINLIKLQKALQVADKVGMDIDRLFEWAKPGLKFWECHHIAEDIRKAIRARYDQEDWEQVVKPLNDQLRENQKQALINYLLVQKELIKWGVVDADSLFEFFLIDVQMCACMETSRIKQAISSVQLFIQRCFLGLEEKHNAKNKELDRDRWEWMQRYRVWEANRKVFLYPENWIEPQLRDDKSPFYKELESELLQKDINPQTVQDALKNYLFKLDEVANLKVVGLFLEQNLDKDKNSALNTKTEPVYIKLHVFARTRNAPYFFYYRYFRIDKKDWYPWEKVQVDIPSYNLEDADGKIVENGTYLIPVVWNRRLLIFFPQFAKKTAPVKDSSIAIKTTKDKNSDGNETGNTTTNVPINKPKEYWEIKMAWSEYRNGKWTQKQLSAEAIYDIPDTPDSLPNINLYEFIPRIVANSSSEIVIDICNTNNTLLNDAFHFAGSQLSKGAKKGTSTVDFDFHYTRNAAIPPQIHSLQAQDANSPSLSAQEPYFEDQNTLVKIHYKEKLNKSDVNFWDPFTHELLTALNTGNLDTLFKYYLDRVIDKSDPPQLNEYSDEAYGGNGDNFYHELKRPYSLYHWEIGFHALTQIVDRLLKSQQFEQAIKMCHYIFNPLAKGTNDKRFWQFAPFKEVDAEKVLEKLFMSLQPGQSDSDINEWRDNPFQPHVIARSRPSAYMKWVVMKYIEILIAWGDYLFRQDTIETINQATQLYVLAAHIYGPRGQKIPKRGKIQPQTYNSLLDKWDAFGNAMVELELLFPFSNQTQFPGWVSNGEVMFANVFGFATTLYFCIPDNPKLRELRNTIDDRLFKIRHCQNIEGVFRKLPLFEPPIEPGLLVQAAAQGLSLSSVLNDLNSPMPNYRFYYLLQKALELCSELKTLGNAFLSAKEKGDAEALSQLRAKHESSIHNLVMEVRKQQLEESQKSLEALQQSRKSPVYRLQHYLKLIGEDLEKVPNDNTDFSELPNQIEKPVDESGLKLIASEKEEMDKASAAADWQTGIGIAETLAGVLHALPNVDAQGKPLGIGVTVKWGPGNLANATQAGARGLRIYADHLSYKSSNAGRKGGFLRQLQDRVQQANVAGYEIKNIDKQILTQQIRINIANQEITNQQKQIDNAQEMEEFLRNKYTNQELYTWMEGQIRTLYYQSYTLAYEMAKKAEKVYRFERGLSTSNFIQFGYWDVAHDGLLAGERLYLALKQLEAAYQEKRGYDYEISKSISLRQVNPMALIRLKETGTCEVTLPEVLFDMDHPGHYMRRLKSVALTIPCVVGPYTSLNCTLRLLEHKFRTIAIAKDKTDYLEKTDEIDDRFSTVNVPITSIAVSTGQNDSGVFELNFRDERYIPFEGAGAISKWRIELPDKFRQFDYDTISDVILHLRYTAVDGGDKLKQLAGDSVQEYIKSVEDLSQQEGLFIAFDLKHDFPNEWYKAMQSPPGTTERLIILNNLNERLPIFTKGRKPDKIQATDIYLLTPGTLSASALTLAQGADEFTFTDGAAVGAIKSFVSKDINCSITSWQLKIQDAQTELDKLWLIVRYILK